MMPIARVQMPDGRIGRFEVPDGTTPNQVMAYAQNNNLNSLHEESAKESTPFIDEFKHGVSAAKDLITNSAAFIRGEEIKQDPAPMKQALTAKIKSGTADRHDYERAFMEGMSNSPGGKFLSAVGGILPEANIVTTALGRWINPAISQATGIDETELALGQMAAAPIAAKAIKSPSIIGENSTLKSLVKDESSAIANPIQITGDTVRGASNLAGKIAKPIIRPVVRGVIENDNPITGEPGLRTALASDTAKEGTRLGDKLGVNFSAGELTGNPTAMGIEDALANSARWGGKFAEANKAKTDAIVGKFNETLDKIYPESGSRTDVGDRLASSYNSTLNSLIKTRDEQAKIDFDSAVKGAGARDENILSNNFFRTLQELKDEGSARLLTSREELGARLANKYLSTLSTKTKAGNQQADTISIYELQKGLSNFSKAAQRPGGVLEDTKTAALRSAYSRLASALQKDLDAEIANPKGDPQRAAMLKIARDNYKNFSDKISDVEKTTLGKLVGNADHNSQGQLVVSPEKIVDRFTSMEPTEIKNTLAFLDKNHPDVAQMARRYTLEKALRQAEEGRGQRGQGTTKDFAKADFVKNLPDDAKLNALMKDASAANDVRDVSAAMNRLIDYGAQKKGSQTAQRTDFLANIAKWGKGAIYRSLVSDTLAEDLLNPAKRKQMAFEARKIQDSRPQDVFRDEDATKVTSKPGMYSNIDKRIKSMTPAMQKTRLASLNKKMDAGILTTKEMYEREALSGSLFPREPLKMTITPKDKRSNP